MRKLACLVFLAACGSNGLPPSGGDGGLPDAAGRTCGDLEGDVKSWLETHLSCSADSDCTLATTRCGLQSFCGARLSTDGARGLTVFLSAWDLQACGATRRCAPCPPNAGQPVGCVQGRCDYKTLGCDAISARVRAILDNQQSLACSADADCIVAPTQCGLPGVCGAYVNQSTQKELGELSAAFGKMDCARGQPCPDCAQPTGAHCNKGEVNTCGP